LLSLARTVGAATQDRKDRTMTAQENATLVRAIYENYNRRDFDAAAASFAQDCEIVNVPLGVTFRGPEGYKQFEMGWTSAFPDSRLEVTNLFATEEQALVEFIGRGTHTAPLQGPTGEIAPTGRKVEARVCDVWQLRNGKVVGWRSYYDALGFLQQLGLIPSQG
jgi:steroid delta-isomerase-like uncharacterized protein